MQNFTEGPLVQIDEKQNAIMGTPLARALHSALLRAGATYNEESNAFVFSTTAPPALLTAMNRMVKEKAYPVAGTYAMALDRWYPELGGRRSTVGDRDAVVFSFPANFARALKGLAKIEDTVNLEPHKLISDRNAVNVRNQLQELNVVYLADKDAYVPLVPGKEAEIALIIAEAGKVTDLQMATLVTALNMTMSGNQFSEANVASFLSEIIPASVNESLINGSSLDIDRHEAAEIIAKLNERFGPQLSAEMQTRYPNLVEETEATLANARIEKIAERTAKIITNTQDAAITEADLGSMPLSANELFMATAREQAYDVKNNQKITGTNLEVSDRKHIQKDQKNAKLETDIFADREASRREGISISPVPEQHPKAQSLEALGVALREMHEIGEATFKDWRLAKQSEVILAPVSAQNADWIIQRDDNGVGVIHDAAILDARVTPKQQILLELAKTMIKTMDENGQINEETIAQVADFSNRAKSVGNRKEADATLQVAREVLGNELNIAFSASFPGFKDSNREKVLEDLRYPITLGTDNLGNTILEQPEVYTTREVDKDVAWAIGTDPSSERLNTEERKAIAKQENRYQVGQRKAVQGYIDMNIREAREIAAAEILRRGIDPSKVVFRMAEPTRIGEFINGEILGQTRDESHTILQMLPAPVSRPPKVMIIQTADLGIGRMDMGDLRKGDRIRFGFEKVDDQLIPYGVERIPSPEQKAAVAASLAASAVNISQPAIDRVPQKTMDQALQKFSEWHRGKTGFEPHMTPMIIDPQPGLAYAGPIVGFAGKYAIQNLGPGSDGIGQITMHDLDMIEKSHLPFVHPDMAITLAYHQEELGQVAPINLTDARPLRDLGYALDRDLARELHISNPDLAKNIEAGLGIARQTDTNERAERQAVLAKWAGQEISL